jgi:hypothetical protein
MDAPTETDPFAPIDLGIDLSTFDPANSISLYEACEYYLTGRAGQPLGYGAACRYANPEQGYRPLGASGPKLVLPTLRWHGARRTMPAWCQAFEQARVRIASEGKGGQP